VTAVADARIQAVIVTAPKDLMGQIAVMMKELDVPSTRDQKVFVFKMENGDPQQAAQVLQNMFQSSSATRGGTSSSQNSALMQRKQNNTTTTGQSTSSGTGFGTSTGGRSTGGRQF
jgi:type II secretory pathway component GspD/PulD (secretin)